MGILDRQQGNNISQLNLKQSKVHIGETMKNKYQGLNEMSTIMTKSCDLLKGGRTDSCKFSNELASKYGQFKNRSASKVVMQSSQTKELEKREVKDTKLWEKQLFLFNKDKSHETRESLLDLRLGDLKLKDRMSKLEDLKTRIHN